MAALPPRSGHLSTLDAVRALAALGIVLFHYRAVRTPGDPAIAGLQAWPALDSLIAHAYLGVDVFFALSGFLLVQPWVRPAPGGTPAPDWRRFYARRARRIVPAYYLQLVFLFAVAAPLLLGPAFLAAHAGSVAYNVVAHVTFLHYTTPLSAGSFGLNGALWTMTLEAEFYLLLPWIARPFARHPARWTLAAIALTVAWRWLAHHDLDPLVAWLLALGAEWSVPEAAVRELVATQLPGYAAQFAVGMALGTLWARGRACATEPAGTPAAFGRFLRAAGHASYPAFLWHLPILLFWNRLRVLDGEAASMPAYLLVVAVVAALSYRWVERPFLARSGTVARL